MGILSDPATSNAIHVPLDQLQRELSAVNRANALWVQMSDTDAASQQALADGLTAAFEGRGMAIAPSSTLGETTMAAIVAERSGSFSLIVTLLAIMAVIIALVGGVGLSGVLSLNVLERRREVGMMRSIGASSWQVIRLFVGEGLLLGLMSWLIALPLSVPAAYLLATRGLSFALNADLAYRFTPTGALVWLVIVTLLALIASSWPARGAARLSVRESLAYQ